MVGSVWKWMELLYADDFAAGLSIADVKWKPILECIDVAGFRFRSYSGDDFVYGNAGIWLLSRSRTVLHGVGAKTASLQFDGRLSATGCACDSGSGYSQSTGKTHFALVK